MNWLTPLQIGVTMGLVFALVVLGLSVAWRLLDFPDITVEGTFLLGAGVFAAVVKAGHGAWLAAVLALLAGAGAGTATALLHAKFRLNKFLAGILMVAALYSVTLRAMEAPNIGLLALDLGGWLQDALTLTPLVAAVALLTTSALSTRRGLRVRVAGSSPQFARALGINVPASLVAGLAATNSLAAGSGVLLSLNQGFADVGMGQGILIIALAGMALGERMLPSRRLSRQAFVVCSAIAGSIVYQTVVAYALALGVPATDLKMATAALVLVVVAAGAWRTADVPESDHANGQ